MNAGAHRRIAYFLSGRRIETSELALGDWKDWTRLLDEYGRPQPASRPTTGPTTNASATTTRPATTQPTSQPLVAKRRMSAALRRKLFFNGIAKNGRYLIVFVNHPRGGKTEGWPGWHIPMRPEDPDVEWWRLYERQPDDTWKVVNVPKSRDYVRNIPPAAD
jgi:hypothetical protein